MIAVFGEAAWTMLALLLYVAWPVMFAQMKRYQFGEVRYGDLASSTSLPLHGFVGIYLLGALLLAAGCAAVLVLGLGTARLDIVPGDERTSELVLGAVVLGAAVIAYLLLGPYQQARIFNLCLARTRFPGARFVSTLRVWPYMRLQLKNMMFTILSLGLYRPFAVVSAYRYRMEHLALDCDGGIDRILAGTHRPQGAVGDGATDFFGIDLSW